MKLDYRISDVRPYINWIYFYHAWDMNGKPQEAKDDLRRDADRLLDTWENEYHTHALVSVVEANGDGDDIVLADGDRIPMLRQQHPTEPGQPNLCLADFLRPLASGRPDRLGLFCATVDAAMEREQSDDIYHHLLAQTLSDRLAEATVERMHWEVRTHYWGYAPDEHLSISDMLMDRFQGIRPAVGYPSLPDTSVNFTLDRLLGMRQIGISLTETGMMRPHASVSGFIFAHPKARYFYLGHIGEDQLADYARRRGLPVSTVRRFLESSLFKK
jgi:cobalamin-dependent methionine synthase I